MHVDWDLSESHAVADVDWPSPDLTSTEVSPVESVNLRFPDSTLFTADSGIQRISMSRKGDQLREISLVTEPLTVDDAYARAVAWAKQFNLPLASLERWHAEGGGVENAPAAYRPSGETLGDDGPQPTVEIVNSFNDEKPVTVVLSFAWL